MNFDKILYSFYDYVKNKTIFFNLILRKTHLYRNIENMNSNTSAEVSIVRCADYARGSIMTAVSQGWTFSAGMKAFTNPGERVLLKPNLLKANRPEEA